jgi:hypothetical protein
MQDKQNKGIGAYQDRPGYFMGGMIGGAILGALVNKIQGKDVGRGAMWGGITGGLGSWAATSMMPSQSAAMAAKAPWWKKMLFSAGRWAGTPEKAGAMIGAGAGLTGAWLAGDPGYDEEKWRQKKLEDEAKRRAEQTKAYKYWHVNPWATGGAVNARPGYPGGGSATLDYSDPDLYTPTGEGGGPSSRPILQIPLGPEGSFAEEFEDLDMSSASDPMDEWNQMYENYLLEGGAPMPLPDFIEMMLSEGDFTPDYGAQGGYKKKPQYKGGGIGDLDMTGGGASYGPGTGTSDDIPAMLSDGEFVVTANAVKNLGGGDRMEGARKMYSMMNQLDPDSQTPAEMSAVGRT